jgi:nucleoside-diphosphate-sugar epimerase
MTVVVTGAAGFVGQALVARLRAEGWPAIGVARREHPDTVRVDDYARSPEGDVLVHLAEDSVRGRVNAKGEAYTGQVLETLRTLCRRSYRRIVYASSAVLYGDEADYAHRTNAARQVVDVYTRVKAESEDAVLARSGAGVVARIANTYGPGMARENVFSTILQQIGLPGPLRVMDDRPVRDFVWIDDVADGLARMAMGQGTGVYNLGTGIGVSVRQLATAALEQAGEPGRAIKSERGPGRRSYLVVDPTATLDAFGWRASTTLAEGLSQLIRATGRNRP